MIWGRLAPFSIGDGMPKDQLTDRIHAMVDMIINECPEDILIPFYNYIVTEYKRLKLDKVG